MKQSPSRTNSEYNQHVGLKYQLYNSLFLTLPLGGVKDVGILIPILAETCRTKLQKGATPIGKLVVATGTGGNKLDDERKINDVYSLYKQSCFFLEH